MTKKEFIQIFQNSLKKEARVLYNKKNVNPNMQWDNATILSINEEENRVNGSIFGLPVLGATEAEIMNAIVNALLKSGIRVFHHKDSDNYIIEKRLNMKVVREFDLKITPSFLHLYCKKTDGAYPFRIVNEEICVLTLLLFSPSFPRKEWLDIPFIPFTVLEENNEGLIVKNKKEELLTFKQLS